jgi:hypothetical protein
MNLLNQANLEAGVAYWRKTKPKWGPDFHNGDYRKFYSRQQKGFDQEWWEWMVGELRAWQASRPKSNDYIYGRGRGRLQQLQVERDRIVCAIHPKRPTLENTDWALVSPLYLCAKAIKGVGSPVFGSKLCHFILPNAFPIIDGEVISFQNNEYARYWDFCRREWLDCQVKQALEALLRKEIGGGIVEYYPWSTKITELCIIGQRHAGGL